MNTKVKNSNKGNIKLNGTPASGKAEQPKVNGLPVSKAFDEKEEEPKPAEETVHKAPESPQAEQPLNNEAQAEQVKPEAEAPKAEAEQPKAEPTKAEIKQALKEEKAPLNLEGTIKLIEILHRRKIQRDKLIDTIDTLEAFEVAQLEDAEETNGNQYQGCELTISDDKRREFSTKNPVIIKLVAEYINKLCLDRLAEIEGEIIIPA